MKHKLDFDLFVEEDESYTLSLKDSDIVVNAKNKEEAYPQAIKELKEYLQDFKNHIEYWGQDKIRLAQYHNFVRKGYLEE